MQVLPKESKSSFTQQLKF